MEAKVKPETARKKAELLAGGTVRIPKDFRLPFTPSKSTAGPGAGSVSIVFAFGNTRAKKPISRESGEFDLREHAGRFALMREGTTFIKDVQLIPTILHAPYQAFVNLDSACVMDCKFCASPRLGRHGTKGLTDQNILKMILDATTNPDFESVAFTSAVPESPGMTVERMARLVREVRVLLPKVPIGVEPYATRPDQVNLLKDAGADEMKLNIETFDRDIFEKVCPKRDYDTILHMINHAGRVFGKNRVCSNIIFGLGESDENILEGTKVLANMGSVATLRALRRNDYNLDELESVLGPLEPVTADRMLALARRQKKILRNYGLSTLTFKTMCHTCLSCDIVPFWDV
jgi:biotin synthase-related radical SAM superfamily protein